MSLSLDLLIAVSPALTFGFCQITFINHSYCVSDFVSVTLSLARQASAINVFNILLNKNTFSTYLMNSVENIKIFGVFIFRRTIKLAVLAPKILRKKVPENPLLNFASLTQNGE